MMNVLLLNPPYIEKKKIFMKEIGRCGSTASGNQFWPQTGLAYLAAVAEQEHNVKIIDGIAEQLNFDEILKVVKQFNPEVILIHTTTPTFKNDSLVLELLKKEHNSRYGFVGNHVSNTVLETLKETGADFVLINEPEWTFKELLEKIEEDWSTIKGIGYKKKGKAVINGLRVMKDNLDELPLPARHLLPNKKYRMVLTNNEPFATIVPSRGCPYSCIYCRVGYPWGKRFRKRSVENVYREMAEVKNKFSINNIVFMADTFTLDKIWVLDLCKKIVDEKLQVNWFCNSRIDSIDKEMAHAMKEAGCSLVSFGVESGNQEILNRAKKNVDLNKAKYAIKVTQDAGIRAFAYFIIGLPGETNESIKKTIKFAKSLNPDYVNFHIATPHPGTELQEMAEKNGWIMDYDYEHYDQSGNYSVMRNENLSAEEIYKAQKKAMKDYYLRPTQVIKQISRVRKPKDLVDMVKIGLKVVRGQ